MPKDPNRGLDRFRRPAVLVVAAISTVLVQACSRSAMGVLLDLPPSSTPQPARDSVQQVAQSPVGEFPTYLLAPTDTVIPPAERILDPDSVLALLPRDHAGNVDWVEAWRQGVIRPRSGIDGPRDPLPGAFAFGFDFYFPGPQEMFDAFFPHSVHTEQIDCAQCHPRIFRTRGVAFQMADILQGRFCGECHGKVAFNPATACERCHTGLAMPPDRVQGLLTGDVRMARAQPVIADADGAGPTAVPPPSPLADGLAPALFPHWLHRIRFECRTCHMPIFEPRAGANIVRMIDIEQGRFCGECHNGTVAFEAGLNNCETCHVPP